MPFALLFCDSIESIHTAKNESCENFDIDEKKKLRHGTTSASIVRLRQQRLADVKFEISRSEYAFSLSLSLKPNHNLAEAAIFVWFFHFHANISEE